ncbi:MAG: class I adenylate-forming enzyme family protein [Thiohalomonadales bacterium]
MKIGSLIKQNRPQRLLRDCLIASTERFPEKEAVIVEGKSYTYAELFNASSCLAKVLCERGVKRGDRVAIYMDNTWPCVVSIYAILFSGGVFFIINPQTKAEKLEFILNNSESKILLTDSHLEKIYRQALKKTPLVKNVITSGKKLENVELKNISIESFDEVVENSELIDSLVKIIPNDLAALIYTSGSTGFPKGVMQTHQSMVFVALSLIEYQRLSVNDRILLVLPIAFDYGLYQLLMAIKIGATLVIERSFTFPAKIYQRMNELTVTVFPAVPTIFAMMISSHKKKKLKFPLISRITNTAAALPANFIPYLHEIFPNALIYKMYGLTECKRISYLEPELIDLYPKSVGCAIPGTEIFLLSAGGKPVPEGEPGILHVRGPHIMAGYWKDPERSKKMLIPGELPGERVLCTHDIFKMDKEGLLYFIGRSDDIIKTRGEKVSPVEIENFLHGITGIKEVGIIGVLDDILGQAIKAFIVLEAGSDLNDKMIKKYCFSHLENFMVPNEIIFIDILPKTSNGKIDKKLLQNMVRI